MLSGIYRVVSARDDSSSKGEGSLTWIFGLHVLQNSLFLGVREALANRCTLSLFHKPAKGKKCGEDARIELYVDDPAGCTRGNKPKRNRNFAVIILICRSLGLRLVFSKAKRGLTVPWIGKAGVHCYQKGDNCGE